MSGSASLPKVSFIIPVLHLKRPKNKSRFFMPRYTLREVVNDLANNVSLPKEIIVVCNGMDPELREFVESDRRIDKFCINKVNVGVSRGWNMGAALAEGEALCFVNDDVQIGKGSMEALYSALMDSPKVGEVGPRGARWKNAQHVAIVGEERIEEADAISGFLFMIKESVFRQIGGFDVRYTPAGFEEVDMSYEIRRRGYKCLVIPKLDVQHHHHHGVSAYRSTVNYLGKSIDTDALHQRNREYFVSKWKDFDAA